MGAGTRRGTGRRRILRNTVVAVLVVVALALVTVTVMRMRAEGADADVESRQYTPPPLTRPTASALPLVAVIGDGTTTQSAPGVGAAQRWTSLLATDADVQVRTFASAGAGYLAEGADGRTFLEEASRVPQDSDLVVIFGGIADVGASQLRVSRAASQTISAVQTRAPRAKIAVIGPVTDDDAPADAVTQLRTTLQNASGAFGLSFVDPIQQAWLNGSPNSPGDLDAGDERTLAARLQTVVVSQLPQS
ncbi:GDSL-type esterase/lipase family protein [Amnibacterium endophyticum]|uniref:GDSL-type esterase/lipase family protein n=1 Tax=Amnibacterium endophyticum TaxID=2109337 RepID=A0ABW4LCR5_9MICO